MSKLDEIILEIDGKISYADATGNHEAKKELIEIRKVLTSYKKERERDAEV